MVRTGLSAAWLPRAIQGKTRSFQEFGFDFMTPIACKKSVNVMSPLWCASRRDLRVCNEVVSIIADATLVRERDRCRFCAGPGCAAGRSLPHRSAPPEAFWRRGNCRSARNAAVPVSLASMRRRAALRTKVGPKPKYGVPP